MHDLGPKKKIRSQEFAMQFFLEIEIITRLGKTKPNWYKGQAALWKKAMGVGSKIHSVEITEIFCHSYFTWNQSWPM